MSKTVHCLGCGGGEPFEAADVVTNYCDLCKRLEAYKEMKIFLAWYDNGGLGKDWEQTLIGVYTSETKADNDAAKYGRARIKLTSAMHANWYVQMVEPNIMADPKVFT